MLRGAFEDHVFEQVRHPCLAVAFVPRADQHGHIYRNFGLRGVGEQEQSQAIIELVFSYALDRRNLLWCAGKSSKLSNSENKSDDEEPDRGHGSNLHAEGALIQGIFGLEHLTIS